MIEINITNFLTIGIMAMVFFSLAEIAKRKLGIGSVAEKSEEVKG